MGLKGAIMCALRGLTKDELEEDDLGRKNGQLQYVALDPTTEFKGLDFFDMWELKSLIKDRVYEYLQEHNVIAADLAAYEVKVALPSSLNFRNPSTWYGKSTPLIQLLFPTYRAGKVVVVWSRALIAQDEYAKNRFTDKDRPVWMTFGTKANGAILYTTTMPPVALDPENVKAAGMPVVIVESPIDAIRLAGIGWWSVALGGVHAPAKIRQELVRLPQKNMIILLDNDAITPALELQEKLQHHRRNVVVAPIMNGDDPASMKKEALREILMRAVAELRALNGGSLHEKAALTETADPLTLQEAQEEASGEAEEAIEISVG